MSKRPISWLIILLSVLAFLVASAIKKDVKEMRAILVGMVVSGTLVVAARYAFGRIEALHYPCLYYAALLLSLGAGFLMYALFAPFPQFSSWSVRLLMSIIASMSIVFPYVLLARLIMVNTLPWERNNNDRSKRA